MSHERYLLCCVCSTLSALQSTSHDHMMRMKCMPPEAGEASMHLHERGFGCHAIRMLLEL